MTDESVRISRKRAVESALKDGYDPPGDAHKRTNSAVREAARRLNESPATMHSWYVREYNLEQEGKFNFLPDLSLHNPRLTPEYVDPPPKPFALEHAPAPAWVSTDPIYELTSASDNTFLFGAAGDLHAGSKYTRWDVRHDLYNWFVESGAQCNFDTGNWIDGQCRFNQHDLVAHGLDEQCKELADNHPKGLKTLAVWGDDHEGWYVQREGIDVGRYNESLMRAHGHDWINLGFMEAHVKLVNANSGAFSWMSVVHPGGGSAYALSYAIQKIIESLEGGEKPAVGLYGHYHKLWSGLIRNVWCIQTGCQQDQTPFMRKKRLEAHVGGILIKLTQDPKTGAIIGCQPDMRRYFNRGYYSNRWSRHGNVTLPERSYRAI